MISIAKIKLSHDGDELSSNTGEMVFREFDEKVGFSATLAEYLQLIDERRNYVHANEDLLRLKIYQLIAEYAEDDAADALIHYPVFTQIMGGLLPCYWLTTYVRLSLSESSKND
ncbi:hypothetical protein J14TS2_33360 [Bacillus sp. J14TS2]|nr:hypothetical protein J14TS2_33360 [Bacillus sp. J14TS2]